MNKKYTGYLLCDSRFTIFFSIPAFWPRKLSCMKHINGIPMPSRIRPLGFLSKSSEEQKVRVFTPLALSGYVTLGLLCVLNDLTPLVNAAASPQFSAFVLGNGSYL